jgi:60 kDa SS-A/Ro ribonucleoprotein
MANKNLFQTVRGLFTPKADTINEAGGTAYKLSPKQALAQYAATGCFSHTFTPTRASSSKKFSN